MPKRRRVHRPSQQTSGHALCRISLFWAKEHCALFSPLSANILREVSEYLCNTARLLVKTATHLLSYTPATGAWKKEFTYATPNSEELLAALYLDETQVFVSTKQYVFRTFLLQRRGVMGLPPLMRKGSGLVYDAPRGRILAFGGSFSGLGSTSCIQLRVGTPQWEELSRRCRLKAHMWPCWHHGMVYLCGGWTSLAEIFDPATDNFRLLRELKLPWERFSTVALSSGADLLIITSVAVLSWSSQTLTTQTLRQDHSGVAGSSPVHYGDSLFYVDQSGTCRQLALRDGTSSVININSA